MTFKSLLPMQASPLRRTVEEAAATTFDVELTLRDIDVPEKVKESFLAYVAWGNSTDLWDRNWPSEKKRAVIKAWFRLHSKKGTLAGIKEAVRFFGAEVVAVRRPPDAFYPDPSMTKAERESFLSRYQQVRLYSFRSRGEAGYGAYLASGYRLKRLFPGGKAFPFVSDAIANIGRRAFLYEPLTGEETPLKRVTRTTTTETKEAVEFEEVVIRSTAGAALFLGPPPKARYFPTDTNASQRRFSLAVQTTYNDRTSQLHLNAVQPSGNPISVRPRRQAVPGKRVKGQLFPSLGGKATEFINRPGDGVARTFLPPSSAPLRIYDQVFLFDPDRRVDKRGARTFLGRARLGMPAYHATLKLQTRAKLSRFAMQQFVSGFLVQTSKARLTQAREAVRISKSLRDKITITAKTMRPATVADGIVLGEINVGAWVRDL